ncbi:MAG: putative sulfate exporter family transporter [Pseudomonadota bacterium]
MADLASLQPTHVQPHLGDRLVLGASRLLPGIGLSALITLCAAGLAQQVGGPVMLYALIAGMMVAPLAASQTFSPGTDFTAKTVLKAGIILLGARVTLADLAALGWQTAILVVLAIATTISVGWWIGRKMKLSSTCAVISAGAVAICGASAALAICAVLPKGKSREQNTVVVVLAVTALSTAAMVLYPVISTALGYNATEAGVFMGVTIHNVAQVIGAGYMVSGEAAETATVVKLMRIACLVPAVIVISILFSRESRSDQPANPIKKPPLLPMFLIGFLLVMTINSLGIIPSATAASLGSISHWALVMSVAALGAKTALSEMLKVGPRCFAVMATQTAMLAAFAMIAISFVMVF